MAKKLIRPIRTEAEHDAALEEIERYFENEPKPGTPEADRFDLLALVVEAHATGGRCRNLREWLPAIADQLQPHETSSP